MPSHDTAEKILDIAERLVQAKGFNGFSYADIAEKLKITKASLHYHFPTKAELGQRLIERYHVRFQEALDRIEAGERLASAKLAEYVELYTEVLRRDRLCLCGVLAADYTTLPKPMREAVCGFFDANEVWLSRVLDAGRQTSDLDFKGPATEVARLLVASLEGAMLVARSYGEVARFSSAAERLLAELSRQSV